MTKSMWACTRVSGLDTRGACGVGGARGVDGLVGPGDGSIN
jgi:hypothetical protein